MQSQKLVQLINAAHGANLQKDFAAAVNWCQQALAISSAVPEIWFNLGVAQCGLGNVTVGAGSLEQARLRTLDSADAQNSIALQLMEIRAYDAAERCLKRALSLSPNYVFALSNLGKLRLQQGRLDDAETHFRTAIKLQPDIAELHVNLCGVLLQKKSFSDAEVTCRRTVDLAPDSPQAWNNLGVALTRLDHFDEAEHALRRGLQIAPDLVDTWINLGNVLCKKKQFQEAEIACRKAVELAPASADALIALGQAIGQRKGPEDVTSGLALLDQAISIEPDNAEAWLYRAAMLRDKGQEDAALASLEKAISLSDSFAEPCYDKGILLSERGEIGEALESYSLAIARRPDFPDAHVNRGLILLTLGDFTHGWSELEYRWRSKENDLKPIVTTAPLWTATPSNRALLLWGEQGIGDQILYSSILPELAEFPQKKYVALDRRLIPLFARSMPGFEFTDLAQVTDAMGFAEQLPLGSLPRYFRPSKESFVAARHPFLFADPQRVAELRRKIERSGKLVCGVSWSSNRKSIGVQKSIDLAQMLTALASDRLHFVNLQYGDTAAERELVQSRHGITVQNLDEVDNFNDIDGLAALIQACDIVVSTSNSTVHLAGALGKETLQLLPFGRARLWYWSEFDGRNLWYPAVHLFGQSSPGDWQGPLTKLRRHIEDKLWN